MILWRLTRVPYLALDGAGAVVHGARWVSPGAPVVNFASEAALAVLVVLRYLPRDLVGIDNDYMLGWTEVDTAPEPLPYVSDLNEKRRLGDAWLARGSSLCAEVTLAVLPEARIIMMNMRHPLAHRVPPLTVRPFDFHACLSLPPAP